MTMPRCVTGLGRYLPVLAVLLAGCDISVGQGGFSVGVGGGRASDVWTRTYTLPADGRLEIVNVSGPIDVIGMDEPGIEVRAERLVKAGSDDAARALLARIEMFEDAQPASLRIETRPPPGATGWSHEVHYTVRVPRGLEIEVRTTNGGLSVNGIAGRVRAVTTNGGVSGRGLAGAIEASTTNGGIRVDFARIAEQAIVLQTVNGGIELRLPERARASLLARCTNGGITVSGLGFETIGERSRRRLEGRLNGGGAARIDVETTNGGIRLSGRS